jgi:putative membrane-bound dehydrogenase-like protein
VLAHLETAGNYPHNGLAGFAFDALGWMYFGFGENLGEDYALFGRESRKEPRPEGSGNADDNPATTGPLPAGRGSEPLTGGGEGGNIYRMRPDGTQLSHWATGFWNPHASCVDAFGQLFSVDNDPDSRPPCRLLHIVPDGDYGYRFRNGRKGIHPFTAWDGELPGTLPMVAGTGEAPSGIVAYESHGLPDDYRGELLVTSWGDHRIDRFRLEPKGVSYTSQARAIVSGGENFRPVGIATAPDGSLYCTDWVLKEYKVHGQGRIWRMSAVEPRKRAVTKGGTVRVHSQNAHPSRPTGWTPEYDFDNDEATRLSYRNLQQTLRSKGLDQLPNENFRDPFVYRAALLVLARLWDESTFVDRFDVAKTPHQPTRLLILLAARRKNAQFATIAERGLNDPDPVIRQAAVQWVGEEKLSALRPRLEEILNDGAVTAELFEAILAALESLDGVKRISSDEFSGAQYVLKIVRDDKRSPALRARALAMLPPATKELDGKLLGKLLATEDRNLKLEAIRTLQLSPLPEAGKLLQGVATDGTLDVELRAEAIVGLALAARVAAPKSELRRLLLQFAESIEPSLRAESLRSLRGLAPTDPEVAESVARIARRLHNRAGTPSTGDRELADQLAMMAGQDSAHWPPQLADHVSSRPRNTAGWLELLASGGDPQAGRRVFFHANGAACARCHTVQGRGARIGPDLSLIARTMNRRKLAESILEPSREIAPQFVAWTLVTKDGLTHSGMIVNETRFGRIQLATSEAKVLDLDAGDIEQRQPQKISIMPEKLVDQLTIGEFRDLLAYLETLK